MCEPCFLSLVVLGTSVPKRRWAELVKANVGKLLRQEKEFQKVMSSVKAGTSHFHFLCDSSVASGHLDV